MIPLINGIPSVSAINDNNGNVEYHLILAKIPMEEDEDWYVEITLNEQEDILFDLYEGDILDYSIPSGKNRSDFQTWKSFVDFANKEWKNIILDYLQH